MGSYSGAPFTLPPVAFANHRARPPMTMKKGRRVRGGTKRVPASQVTCREAVRSEGQAREGLQEQEYLLKVATSLEAAAWSPGGPYASFRRKVNPTR